MCFLCAFYVLSMCFLHAVHVSCTSGMVDSGQLPSHGRLFSSRSTGSLFNWWAPGRLETNHRRGSPEVLWWPPHLQAGVQVSGPLSVQIQQLPAPRNYASPFSVCPSCPFHPFPCPLARHMAILLPDSLQTWSARGPGMALDIRRQDWSPWRWRQTDGPTLSPQRPPSKLLLRHPSPSPRCPIKRRCTGRFLALLGLVTASLALSLGWKNHALEVFGTARAVPMQLNLLRVTVATQAVLRALWTPEARANNGSRPTPCAARAWVLTRLTGGRQVVVTKPYAGDTLQVWKQAGCNLSLAILGHACEWAHEHEFTIGLMCTKIPK